MKDLSVGLILNDLRTLVQALTVASRNAEKARGLSGAQLYVLQQLKDVESLTIGELAERTHTHQSTVSVMVSKLVDKKLASRERSAEDARVQNIALTPLGRKTAQDAPKSIQDQLVDALRAMKLTERALLATLLADMLRRVGLAEGAPTFFLEYPAKTGSSEAKANPKRPKR